MAYKNKPHQYLLTVTKGYQKDWEYLNDKAIELEIPLSELIRKILRKQVEEWRYNHDTK